ncbi:hypothetical protein [Pseudonocardia nigra]|uniref:hypothetical protein n=1 Tax=Pseudonocardia nigra TaxID=1921578 RepID=UPI0027E233F0|nr:hypothetical protein [Pseudonocardia nigra]
MNAVSVPIAINVSMFALNACARCAATFRNGQPATNCTGTVAANATHRAHG